MPDARGDRRFVPVGADNSRTHPPGAVTGGVGLVRSGGLRSGTWYPAPMGPGPSRRGPAPDWCLGSGTAPDSPPVARSRSSPSAWPPSAPFPHPLHPARDSRAPRRLAAIVAVAFAVTSIGVLAVPRHVYAWDAGSVQLQLREAARQPDEPVARVGRAQGAQGRLDADLDRPVAKQGHDHPRLLQPQHPAVRLQRLRGARQEGYCYAVAGENIGWNNYPDDLATGAVHQAFMSRPATVPTSSAGSGTSSASAPTRARAARRCGP